MEIQQGAPEELLTENNPPPGDLLCQAVMEGDLAAVQRLLNSGIDPNVLGSSANDTALMGADSVALVELLLKAGANIHLTNKYGDDALVYALGQGNEAVVKRLMQAGADLNWRNKHGWTRLHAAAFQRDPDSLALLLKLSADLTLERGKLLSAASWYARAGYHEATERTIDLLVAAGEDVHATDHYGYTALHCAVHDYAHTPSSEHWWNASSDGSDETATRALLKHGAAPNAAGSNGMTPLLLAARSSRYATACIAALLAAGADIEKGGNDGITPLMRAAYAGQVENLRLLLAHGANVSRMDRFGHDARYYAELYLANLSEEVDEQVQVWRREQEEKVRLCIALLAGSSNA